MVKELLDHDKPRNHATVSIDQYRQWARGFVFEGLRDLRYGQSFCTEFAVTDNILWYERDYQAADDYIHQNYVR